MSSLPIRSYLIPDTCAAWPLRSPFSKSGYGDAGFFFYVTNRQQWSVMLEAQDPAATIRAADLHVPCGYAQLWVFEKMYSSQRTRKRIPATADITAYTFSSDAYSTIPRSTWAGNLYVVFKEPYPFRSRTNDVLAYQADEKTAIADADIYTHQTNRRAVVGLMRADIYKH